MNPLMSLENQLLITKFYVPVTSGLLISRPRLIGLLNESRKYPLTLVSAAAGFGKTTLLASWAQSLEARGPRVAWVSLEEENNDPQLFWVYVLTALNRQLPERFTSLLTRLQSSQSPPLNTLLAELINLLVEGTDDFLLILDDYHLITEQQVHTALAYLIEHLPPQLRIIMATRVDPPLPLALLRAREQALEVRTDQLRCTPEETKAFLYEVMDIHLSDETVQEVTARTEGWLVGLQLLGLSLPDHVNPANLLKEISGDQRYILDYLTEEVLRRQPQEVQTFLLCTSILDEQFSASLCDAVMERTGSQQMLRQIERANLFAVSLDSKRQWHRYHALFAQALRCQLEQRHADLVPLLHHRASIWYAEQHWTTPAVLHALHAQAWQWAADLIEQAHLPVMLIRWGGSGVTHELTRLQEWLEQLPAEVTRSRPQLYLICAQLLWQVAPPLLLQRWLDTAEEALTTSLISQTDETVSPPMFTSQVQQDQKDLYGMVISCRAFLRCIEEDGEAALPLCQQALALLSAKNIARIQVAITQFLAYYISSANDAVAAIESALQAVSLAQETGEASIIINTMFGTAFYMLRAGRLHEAERLAQQAIHLGAMSPLVSWPTLAQAELLREWNQLDRALSLAEEAIPLCKQIESVSSLSYLHYGYEVLLRIHLSRGELDAACSAFEEVERIGMNMNQPVSLGMRSFSLMSDQVRLWLACGDLDRAIRWAEEREVIELHDTPFGRERGEVARARILLAMGQAHSALQRLEPVLQRATTGQRWGNVIEIRFLQALAHQMLQEEVQALDALSEAARLAEPEGYIRSFVDEGAPMESLLYRLRKRNRKHGPTPYLDTLLVAFQQETKTHAQAEEPTQAYQLPEPLSEREREVLQLLAGGASNQEIAQELVIAVDTVKRHTSHIFSKLGVHTRMQAVLQAREMGLLDEEV